MLPPVGTSAGRDSLKPVLTRFRDWWAGGTVSAYAARFAAVVGALLAIKEAVEAIGFTPSPTSAGGRIFLTTTIYFASEFVRLLARERVYEGMALTDAFLSHLDLLIRQDKHEAVVRYHSALSRLLWVEGELAARVEIGTRIKQSAAAIGAQETLAGVLIDDLGWTNEALGNHEEAKANILRGIEIAQEAGNHYWSAKGYRHLAGIAITAGELAAVVDSFRLAREAAARIDSPNIRLEILAGIDYGEAVFALSEGDGETALALADASEQRRKQVGDDSRTVKVYALRGAIEERLKRPLKAAEAYGRGLRLAKKIGRVDEEIRCLQGLARLEKDPAAKFGLEQEASRLKARTPIPWESWRK